MTHQEKINSAASLTELTETLNKISAELTESESITDTVAICDLPIFGGDAPDNTSEVWSWDEHNVLVEGNNGAWIIEPRCQCGEASFHCQCGESMNGYKTGDKNYDQKFENSLNGIDPETLTEEEIEAQEKWLEENEDG